MREPQINLICKKHNIDRKLTIEEKIHSVVNAGISFSQILIEDLHKDGTTLTDKKRFINELIPEKDLLKFCEVKEIKTRGDIISNILDAYKDSEKLIFRKL